MQPGTEVTKVPTERLMLVASQCFVLFGISAQELGGATKLARGMSQFDPANSAQHGTGAEPLPLAKYDWHKDATLSLRLLVSMRITSNSTCVFPCISTMSYQRAHVMTIKWDFSR